MRIKVSLVILAMLAAPVSHGWAQESQQTYEVVVERGVAAAMRDGVKLRADIYRPRTEGKFPVLLAAHAVRQERWFRLRDEGSSERLRGCDSGCARTLHLRG